MPPHSRHKWKPFDVCLLDKTFRVKVHACLRMGREVMIKYHNGWPDEVVNVNRLSPLPMNNQP
jgi:hypothetical protein